MTNEFRNSNSQKATQAVLHVRYSGLIRHLAFVIRHLEKAIPLRRD
jgi:hypothetical protein